MRSPPIFQNPHDSSGQPIYDVNKGINLTCFNILNSIAMSLFSRLTRNLNPDATAPEPAVVPQGKTEELSRRSHTEQMDRLDPARELLQQGNLDEALAEIDRVVSIFGQSVEALELQVEIRGAMVARNRLPEEEAQIWYDRGNQFYSAGDFGKAIASYDQAVKIKPDYHKAWSNRGVSLANLGQHEQAIASYDQAVKVKSDCHEAWSNWGLSLNNLGQYEAAIQSYDQAVKIKPDYHEAWSNRGVSLKNLGQYEKAIASYDQAVKIKPDYHEAWSNRGVSLRNLGQYEKAIASYDQAVNIKPDCHGTWYNRGVSLDDLDQYDAAIASYDQAVNIKPDYHEAWYNRSIAAFSGRGKSQPNGIVKYFVSEIDL
jgi:tetratricopeptide (TPR) repeat protein